MTNNELIPILMDAVNIKENNLEAKEQVKRVKKGLEKLIIHLVDYPTLQKPKNYKEFYNFLFTVPIREYLKNMNSDQPFYDHGLNELIRLNYVNEEINQLELQQNEVMKEILLICRENRDNSVMDYQKIYVSSRSILSEKSLREKIELDNTLMECQIPPKISQLIQNKAFSRTVVSRMDLEVCPICGKEVVNNSVNTCTNEVCDWYIQNENLVPKKIHFDSKVIRLTEGLYKYCLTPGIGEKKIYSELVNKFSEENVKMYPNIDEYDIEVQCPTYNIFLDVKDYENPNHLAEQLSLNANHSKLEKENVYLVIPTHRIQIYAKSGNSDYMRELKNALDEYGLHIKCISQKNLIRKVESEFDNYD